MKKARLQGGMALLGLVLMASATVAWPVAEPRWVFAVFALGVFCVMAYLVANARALLREVRTLRSNIDRGRKQQNSLLTAGTSAHAVRIQETVLQQTQSLRNRMDDLEGLVRETGKTSESTNRDLSVQLEQLRRELSEIPGELERLLDTPAMTAWRELQPHRKEGTCCLLMGVDDTASILSLDGPPARFLTWDPAGTTRPAVPNIPAHAVGAVLVDLDLVIGLAGDHRALATFFRWLRTDVPVVGFTRTPQLLAHRAANLSRLTDGVLFPAPISVTSVRFTRMGRATSAGQSAIPAKGQGDEPS